MVTVASRDLAVRRRKVSPTSTGNVSCPLLQRCAGDPETIEPIFRDETTHTLEGSSEFVPAPEDQGGWNVLLAWSERATGVSRAQESKNSWTWRIDGGAQGASPEVQGGGRAPLGPQPPSRPREVRLTVPPASCPSFTREVARTSLFGKSSVRACWGHVCVRGADVWVGHCCLSVGFGVQSSLCIRCVCQCFGDKGSARSLRLARRPRSGCSHPSR